MAVDVNSMGTLRSKIVLTLHTYHAARLWWGRGVESGKPQIIGMRQFLFLTGAIQRNVTRDDPYADHWMLKIDVKLKDVRETLDVLIAESERVLNHIPDELTIEENINQKPFTTQVYTGGQQGWLAVTLLADFDRAARNILLAAHTSFITRDDAFNLLRQANRSMRGMCAYPQRYPGYSGVSRDDVAANNAKAREAREKFGELPKDVLEGTLRSPFAPRIHKPESATARMSSAASKKVDSGKGQTKAQGDGELDLNADLNDEPLEGEDADSVDKQ